ncbi:MAG: dTDP-4-dehydrorhamnose reductase [Firmicutes bacterium]|nr:dTDP-4-dehydrorhamnose reductase [Bacillota bacterium]
MHEVRRKVLITGAQGMLGQDMAAEFAARGWEVRAVGHRDLDVTNLRAVRGAVAAYGPELVVNCAAYTNVDRAESEPALAMAVNALGPRNLALACLDTGAALLHISTDYVFSGEKEEPYAIWDPAAPVNVYGRSKLWGENYVRSLLPRHYVVRTSWLFGPGGRNFVRTLLSLGRQAAPLRVVADQWGCPTYTPDLAGACADLAASGAYGIYHVTNQGPTTWYDFACAILAGAGLVGVPVQPVTASEYRRPARRPRNSVLDPYPLAETIGHLLPPWPDALKRYLVRELAAASET